MILIRHGQSEFNVHFAETRQDPGIRDPKLTDLGRRQIAAGADYIARHHGRDLRRIVTSPYTRTLQSAAILSEKLGLPVEIDLDVREHAFFTCDIGTSRADLENLYPALDFAALADIWWPDSEEDHHVEDRARTFRTRMAGHDDWAGTLVVSHWGFIRALTGHRVPNAAVLRLDPTAPHPDGGEVVSIPDVC